MARLVTSIRALALLAVGCTPAAMPLAADHPASPAAPVGRLAGPPAALRPGVVTQEVPAPVKQPAPAKQPAPPQPQGHEGHH